MGQHCQSFQFFKRNWNLNFLCENLQVREMSVLLTKQPGSPFADAGRLHADSAVHVWAHVLPHEVCQGIHCLRRPFRALIFLAGMSRLCLLCQLRWPQWAETPETHVAGKENTLPVLRHCYFRVPAPRAQPTLSGRRRRWTWTFEKHSAEHIPLWASTRKLCSLLKKTCGLPVSMLPYYWCYKTTECHESHTLPGTRHLLFLLDPSAPNSRLPCPWGSTCMCTPLHSGPSGKENAGQSTLDGANEDWDEGGEKSNLLIVPSSFPGWSEACIHRVTIRWGNGSYRRTWGLTHVNSWVL